MTCKTVVGGADSCATEVCNPLTGKCAVTADPTACDDKNPCTTDICDGKTAQCSTLPVPDGTGCGDDKSCNAGACVEEPDGMVLVPAGKGWMGCTTNDFGTCPAETKPAEEVDLSAFWIDRYEVRVGDYAAQQPDRQGRPPRGQAG